MIKWSDTVYEYKQIQKLLQNYKAERKWNICTENKQSEIDFYSKTNQIPWESLNTLLAVMCVVFYQSWFFHQDKWANSCSKQCWRHQTQSSNTPNIIQPSPLLNIPERETSKRIETLINGLNYGLYGDYAKLLNTVSLWQHTRVEDWFLPTKIMFYWTAYRDYVENSSYLHCGQNKCTPWLH